MLIVDPYSMTDDLVEWIRQEVMHIHLEHEVPISEAYGVFIWDQLGLHLTTLKSPRGWIGGVLHKNKSLHAEVQEEVTGRLRCVFEEIDAVLPRLKKGRSEFDAVADQLQSITVELEGLSRDCVSKALAKAFSGAVFGVNMGDVACALVLRQLDPDVDVFLDGERFASVYTKADWAHLCSAFSLFIPSGPNPDPRQLWLFDSEAHQQIEEYGQECHSLVRLITGLDPACVIGRRWADVIAMGAA